MDSARNPAQSPMWPVVRPIFTAALLLFVVTIVIGILNGTDIVDFERDETVTHLHAGTLGWITLGLAGIALLMFTEGRSVDEAAVRRASTLGFWMIVAVTVYVAAFYAGDTIWDDRIQRPIAGTALFVVVVWFLVWLVQSERATEGTSVARLGLLLSWISLVIGAVFGIALGIFTARGEIPGLDVDTANAIADAHPPAMVIGYLILAAMAVIEWLLRGDSLWSDSRSGVTQMWILFAAGVLVNVGFVSGLEEELLGPANLLMIAGVVMLVVRTRDKLVPAGWSDSGTGAFARLSTVFLVVYLVLGTVLIVRVVSGAMDFDALTDTERGLVLSFDHTMFIGVMTNLLFGLLATSMHGRTAQSVDRILLWGVNIGIAGFAVGLVTVNSVVKRIFTPLMGVALLIGIFVYLKELRAGETQTADA